MYGSINYLLLGLKFETNHETVLGKEGINGTIGFTIFLLSSYFIVKTFQISFLKFEVK